MTMRVPALQHLSAATGESLVAWEHTARMMNPAPGRYSTALGRGIRQADMTAEWLLSTFLAGAIGDPKNAAAKVPLFGDMQLVRERFETRETEYEDNALFSDSGERTVIMNIQYDPAGDRIGETLFDALLDEVQTIALFWNDESHKRIHRGFKAELHLGGHAFAKTSLLLKREGSKTTWIHRTYAPSSQNHNQSDLEEAVASEPPSPLQRIALITGQHLTLLAMLLDPERALLAPSLAPDNATHADASPTNENGAPARAPRTRIQDHGLAAPAGHAPDDTRERETSQALEISQASLSHGPGPSPNRHRKDHPQHGRTTDPAAGPGG